MNRFKAMMFTALVVAVTALLWGNVAMADTAATAQPNAVHAIRNPNVDPKLSPAQRARAQRQASINKSKATKKFIQSVVEGKQPASSDNGGAK